ncbi:hypothetical protein MPTK1_1g09710 [Marchantia polymorpha subsp. ruderalis]|uniref:Uncharacterized protein n=2 Tax=Marchantia polymorpha TaxID=3197 RepID=A0A176VD22_MARPO|nr:hypothetical protein AXG93_313s1050 [Marchantia polymorpha subsp. ruderalis]PTQ32680.1 hypothetical protein MARPO_0096s0030 [Marchantia polymorpha]PTQ32681.1 hypothetical protein MARPO_0096s0030 [Marchantia polymorpha]BBM97949.1 hypothetical protein Mp_1g09710 [Marchantia polymorpha subsp. ruderalis]BBM97950.1 hypothetical protein Mp_1g09710 [Marchantia polymorpha subsp. ruderalis]|eukprot:PTQ32680.1 hypothetical protein MARPO_0096s0030 [Marchantia polymorpha]
MLHRSIKRCSQILTEQTPGLVRRCSSAGQVSHKRLDGKVAIITGAAGAVGSVTAKVFADHGANVIVTDINDEAGEKVAQAISQNAVYRHCDVSKESHVAGVVDYAVKEFGKLDILHCNAGRLPAPVDFQTLDMEQYDRATGVLFRAVVLGIKHAARVMVPQKQGSILITASSLSLCVDPGVSLLYNLNKTNLVGLTKIAAGHLGSHGIRVNAVAPGPIPTEMSLDWAKNTGVAQTMDEFKQWLEAKSPLLGKLCTERDIANGALFLCSDESRYVNGHVLAVSAGYHNLVKH